MRELITIVGFLAGLATTAVLPGRADMLAIDSLVLIGRRSTTARLTLAMPDRFQLI